MCSYFLCSGCVPSVIDRLFCYESAHFASWFLSDLVPKSDEHGRSFEKIIAFRGLFKFLPLRHYFFAPMVKQT